MVFSELLPRLWKMRRKWEWALKLGRFRHYSSSSSSTTSFPLKHVTKSNFASTLAELRSLVRAADFVAIDLEMSGVTSSPWRESFEFDSSDIRYLKVKDSAEKFAVLQFGLCPFRWDPQRLSFLAHPHNFFVFPREDEFLCQTASLEFLAKFHFDFNTCMHQGISYLSKAQEEEALRQLDFKYQKEVEHFDSKPLVNVTDVLFSTRMKHKLTQWRDALLSNASEEDDFRTVFYKGRPAVSLSGFTPHQIRMVHLVVMKHFEDLAFVRVDGEDSCSERLVVYTESQADKDLLWKEVKEECHKAAGRKIDAEIGFRHVIDLLSTEKKLFVGHNCFLDIAHIYSKFLGRMPLTAEEFVTSLNKYFPYIVDTKILLNSNNALQQRMKKSSTTLSSAFNSLCPEMALGSDNSSNFSSNSFVKVEVQVDDARSSNWNFGVKHEAGYDAFMTGCVFARACNHLGIEFQSLSPTDNLASNEKLQKHLNLLYLSWIGGDIINLRTGDRIAESSLSKKRHPKIVFKQIVLIWGFPSNLRKGEIAQCISKVFGPTSVRSVFRVDETAVFVQFSKVEFVSEFLALKESLENGHEAVSVLHPLWKLLEGGNTYAAGYETYKDICSSSFSKLLFADQAEAIGVRLKTKLVESNVDALPTEDQHGFQIRKAAEIRYFSVEEIKNNSDRSSDQPASGEIDDSFYSDVKQIRAAN